MASTPPPRAQARKVPQLKEANNPAAHFIKRPERKNHAIRTRAIRSENRDGWGGYRHKLYAKELVPTPIEEFEKLPEDEKKLRKPYPFNQRTYEAAPGIICDQDVAVPMRDGVILYADIFRPADSTAKVPVILAWSNYGKRPNEYRPDELKAYTPGVPKGSISDLAKFEAADPEFWVPNGYAVANVDIRGIGYWADKIPDFSKVVVPAYVTAGWNHFHLQGSVNG